MIKWHLLIVALLLLLFAVVTQAQTAYPRPPGWEWYGTAVPNGTVGVNYVSGGVQLVGDKVAPSVALAGGSGEGAFIGRTFGAVSSQGVQMTESVGARVGGNAIVATGARVITAAEAANAAAMLYGAWNVGFAIGTAIYDYLGDDTRMVPAADGWMFDPGQLSTQSSQLQYAENNHLSAWFASPQAACAAAGYAVALYINQSGIDYCRHADSQDQYQYGNWTQTGIQSRTNNVPGCPASVDALNPAYSIPAGSSPGKDGKCRTGRYNPIPLADAINRLTQYANPLKLPDLIPQVIADGVPLAGTDSQPLTVSPTSVVGQPTVERSTNPDGSTVIRTSTPTVNYGTNGTNTITYNTTNNVVTQTCTAAGSCTTTNTTTTTTPAPDPTKDQCEANPSSLGCATFGTPDTTSPTWKTPVNVDFAPVDIGVAGSCPAPRNMAWRGTNLQLNYQPLCDIAPVIKLGLLAMTALSCAFMIVRTVRQ